MKIYQAQWTLSQGWKPALTSNSHSQLVLLFGATEILKSNTTVFEEIRKHFPHASLFGCSTAGEILDTRVSDDSIIITAVQFEKTSLKNVSVEVKKGGNSYEAGKRLAGLLPSADLAHVLVLSDGLSVNGTDLVKGMTEVLPKGVTVTGGLSGDGSRFQETFVVGSNGTPLKNTVAALGLYGKNLKVGYASLGGWDSFGPERTITRASGNVLYELDGRSALDIYKQYLGEHAKGLPATGLLFPLSVRQENGTPIVRTILGVDEKDHSMTFAGNMPEKATARFMKANFDRLIDGASGAAKATRQSVPSSAELAILISCVGRKLILKQRIEEEVEGVREVLGPKALLAGFYSYGEISPFTPGAKCELHNQTMTITTLSES